MAQIDINNNQIVLQKELRKAIWSCDYNKIKKLLETKEIDINFKHKNGYLTNLILAMAFINTSITELLIQYGADVNITIYRRENNHFNKLESPIIIEAKTGNVDNVLLLLKYNANIYYKDYDGKTAFEYAKEENNHEVLKLLLKKHRNNKNNLSTMLFMMFKNIDNYCIQNIVQYVYYIDI
jgi:ankyrin repeat protein